MGKRILIIDNRQQRAQRYLNDDWDLLNKLQNVCIVATVPDEQSIMSFDVIAMHGSMIIEYHLGDLLAKLVKARYVILFSGAVSLMHLSNEGHLLKVPAVTFYSHNLIPFCNYLDDHTESDIQLLAIVYGIDHCRLPILLLLRQLLWQGPRESQYLHRKKIDELKIVSSLADVEAINDEINKELRSI